MTHLEASTLEEWRSALERLLRNPAERRAMAEAGRRYAVEHYSVDDFAARLAAVIHGVAAGRAGSP